MFKALGGVATFIGLSATVFVGVHPNWGKEHPVLADGLYLLTGLCVLWLLLQSKQVQRWLGLQPIPKDAAAVPTSGVASTAWPKLGCEHLAVLTLHYRTHLGQWIEDQQRGADLFCVKVLLPAQVCEPVGVNFRVRATVRCKELTGFVEQVGHAYWVNRSSNTKSFQMGKHAYVILGHVLNGHWVLYDNPYSDPLRKAKWGQTAPQRSLGRTATVQGDCSGVAIDLQLFNERAGLVGSAKFTIVKSAGGIFNVLPS